jgi:hypothetical protein
MTSTMSGASAANPEMTSEARQAVLNEIAAKWSRFSERELSALTGNYDLVNHIVAKYGIEKAQAQRDVDALLKGRYI